MAKLFVSRRILPVIDIFGPLAHLVEQVTLKLTFRIFITASSSCI